MHQHPAHAPRGPKSFSIAAQRDAVAGSKRNARDAGLLEVTSASTHGGKKRQLGVRRERSAGFGEPPVHRHREMRPQGFERGVIAPEDSERIGDAAAVRQIEGHSRSSGALAGLREEQNGDVHVWNLHG